MDNKKVIIEIESNKNILINNSIEVQREFDKIGYLVEDMRYNYFGKYSSRKEDDITNIVFLFEKYGAYISLIEDSINKVKNRFDMLINEQVRENEKLIGNINEYDYTIIGEEGLYSGETEEYFVRKDDGKVVEWYITNNDGKFKLNVLDDNKCIVKATNAKNFDGATCILNAKLENGKEYSLEIMNVGLIPLEIKEFRKETNK